MELELQSLHRHDLHTVVVAVTEPFTQRGLEGVGCVYRMGVGGLKEALHGSIWGTRITALNQLKVLG